MKKEDVIDTYETKREDGTIEYIDKFTYNDRLAVREKNNKREIEELNRVLEKIRENNPLNNLSSKNQSSCFGKLALAGYDDNCIVTTKDGMIIVDDFKQAVNRMKQNMKSRRFSLKRAVATLGVAIGLTAAVSSVSNFILNRNHRISIETPTKGDPNIMNNHGGIQAEAENLVKARNNHSINHEKKTTAIRLGDKIQLKNTKLYYNSHYQKPCVGTKTLECDYYKINRIAILSKNGETVLRNVKIKNKNKNLDIEKFKESYRILYGEDIQFQINADGFINGKKVYEQAGWTSSSNVQSKSKRKIFRKNR